MRFIIILAALLCAPGIIVYAEIQQDVVERDTIGGTGGGGGDLSATDIDTFSELDAIVADEGLVNLNDNQTLMNKLIDGSSNTVKILRHATDCTAFTGAVEGQYCWEQDDDVLYVCETVDECDTAGEWDAVASGGGGAVDSVFGRTGTVTAASSDYDAAQVDNTPAGSISATNVQGAIDELEAEKLGVTGNAVGVTCTDCVALGSETINNYVANVATTSPLSGGSAGSEGASLTLTIADAAADGSTKGAASFTANDFNAASGNISIDYTNGQAASGSNKGFLTSADWTAFNNKLSTGTAVSNIDLGNQVFFQLRPQSNEPPASSFATFSTRNSHPTLRFNGNVCAIWTFVLPNLYQGNGITVEFWYASTETTNDTDWDGSWERIDTAQDIDADNYSTPVSADNNNNNATSGIPTQVSIAFTDGAQLDSCAAGEICRFRLCRDDTADTGGADTIDYIGGAIRETP